MPEYLPVNRVLGRSDAIEYYLSLQLDLWETIREVHTFGTNRKIQAALWQRERESTHRPFAKKKKPLKTAKTNDTLSFFVAFFLQTNTRWLRSSFLTGSLVVT